MPAGRGSVKNKAEGDILVYINFHPDVNWPLKSMLLLGFCVEFVMKMDLETFAQNDWTIPLVFLTSLVIQSAKLLTLEA